MKKAKIKGKQKTNLLRSYVAKARKMGFNFKGKIHGGGWVNLATVCGYTGTGKGGARLFLENLLGAIDLSEIAVAPKTRTVQTKPANVRARAKKIDPNSVDFLLSYEWRKLRMKVIEKYGRLCMCCGDTPERGAKIVVDHIKPRSKYPHLALEFDNLQILCDSCNHGKGAWLERDYRPEAAQPRALLSEQETSHLNEITRH